MTVIIEGRHQSLTLKELTCLYNKTVNHSFYRELSKPISQDDMKTMIEGEMIYVASTQGKVVGFLTYYEPEGFIHLLFIHPDYQGQQIGSLFLEELEKRYPTQDFTLKCLLENKRAIAFYCRKGFEKQKIVYEDEKKKSYMVLKKQQIIE